MHFPRHYRILMIVALTALVGVSDLALCSAQAQQDKRLFGGGRFLRRIRNEITGDRDKPKSSKENAAKDKKDASKNASKEKQPTLAKPKSLADALNLQRTPAPNTSNEAGSLPRIPSVLKPSNPLIPRPSNNTASQRDISRANPGSTREPSRGPATKSSANSTLGFGMLVVAKDDKLFVKQLDPKGNAREAGIRIGDQLVSGGGVDFSTVEEFDSISEILKDGDQLEFEINRRGKDEKLLVAFGEAPEPGDAGEFSEAPATRRATPSSQVNTKDNYSFLPSAQADRDREPMQSILERNRTSSRATDKSFQPQPAIQPARPTSDTQSTIRRQQLEIERLRQQLQQMKNQSDENPIGSGLKLESSRNASGPALTGPGR